MNEYTEQVRDYLRYCRQSAREMEAAGSQLDPKYHPTVEGCVKQIPHGGDTAKAALIKAAFRELTEGL